MASAASKKIFKLFGLNYFFAKPLFEKYFRLNYDLF
jgi:riboflavin transporter FmnP